jgi:hypothetical protein
MRVTRTIAAAALLLLLPVVAACTSAAPGEPLGEDLPVPEGTPVAAGLFGTHVKSLAVTGQQLPPRAGAIRLWDSGVSWRELEPVSGQVRWDLLDAAISEAESTGAEEIVWVHGSPPAWAALDPEAPGLYGPGTSSAPDQDAYLAILRQVADRYRGRITGYQVWNEANIKIFYRGKPDYLAELTLRAKEVLAEVDPDAVVVGASTTVRRAGPVKAWYGKYTAALAERGWPVDAMAVHLYPLADQGAGTRAAYIRTMRAWLAERGWTGPVWDTEVNYGDRRDFATEIVQVPQPRAASWVARTYIDSLALGIDRVHWYSWNDHILGIDQVDAQSGEVLPAGQAFLTVQEWLVGSWWQGCTGELMDPTGESGAVTTCALATVDRLPARILFSHGEATSIPMPEGAMQVCQLDGTCAAAQGDALPVGTAPILVRLSA